MISFASSNEIKRAGKLKIFASLCWRARTAMCEFQQSAERILLCLFAVILAPFPLPQIMMPISDL